MCRGDTFAFRILVHKPVQKHPLRRSRKCRDNIKLDVMGYSFWEWVIWTCSCSWLCYFWLVYEGCWTLRFLVMETVSTHYCWLYNFPHGNYSTWQSDTQYGSLTSLYGLLAYILIFLVWNAKRETKSHRVNFSKLTCYLKRF
jgi:hypothetical protein